MTMWRREVYENDDGRKVTLLMSMDRHQSGEPMDFRFVAELQVQPPGSPVLIGQRVDLKATTLADAFAELPEAEVEAVRLVNERLAAAAKRLVTAREVPALKNGKLRMSE